MAGSNFVRSIRNNRVEFRHTHWITFFRLARFAWKLAAYSNEFANNSVESPFGDGKRAFVSD